MRQSSRPATFGGGGRAVYSSIVSDKTYSAREIVLSLFPGTAAELVPLPEPYRFERLEGGVLRLLRDGDELARLAPVPPPPGPSVQLSCDLCKWSAPRSYLQLFRAEVPGSRGRRYRYVSLCRDTAGCGGRRGDDAPVEQFLGRVFGP